MPSASMGGGDRSSRLRFRKILKYAFMPEIASRVKRLGKGLSSFAYMLALIFRSVGLLPARHPLLLAENFGRYGIIDVIAIAANNLVISKKNVDQILIFGAVVLAVIMTALQVGIIVFYAFMNPGVAQAASEGMFSLSAAAAEKDVVLTFLQQTIGLDGFFNNSSPVGFSLASGVRAMLGFYSTGLMLVATCIVVYYVITVVGESAQSGTPFGRRFNGLWAPIRLVLALGLLVPLGNGLNASQYIVLSVAKAGSSFATQSWNKFVDNIVAPKLTLPPVEAEGLTAIGKSIFLSEVCAASYNFQNSGKPQVEIVRTVPKGASPSLGGAGATVSTVDGDNVISIAWKAKVGASYANSEYHCGAVKINYSVNPGDAKAKAFADAVAKAYVGGVDKIIADVKDSATKYASRYTPGAPDYNGTAALPDSTFLINSIKAAESQVRSEIQGLFNGASSDLESKVMGTSPDKMKEGGWGKAATFYMRFASGTQQAISLVKTLAPIPTTTDAATQAAAIQSSEYRNSWWTWSSWRSWFTGDKDEKAALGEQAQHVATAISKAQDRVNSAIPDPIGPVNLKGRDITSTTGGTVGWALSSIFLAPSIYDLANPNTQNVHPIVKLTNIGGEIIARSFAMFAGGALISLLSGALGNFVLLFAFLGIGIGFILSYVLPLMPFIYFFFAIVEWGMGVLEGLLGAPLWALAHLRIDGEGMPGQAAMQGYNILLTILLRPIFILFALMASFTVFSAGAYFLNLIYAEAILNDLGVAADPSVAAYVLNPINIMGYLLMYAVIAYNLGLVCFKMIDQVPANVMRWMGLGNLHYQDGKPDPIGNTTQMAAAAGALLGPQVAGAAAKSLQGKGFKGFGGATTNTSATASGGDGDLRGRVGALENKVGSGKAPK